MRVGSLQNLTGAILRRILPPAWYRILRRPALVPGEYKRFIQDIERVRDSLMTADGLDDEYWAAVLRKHAHILDKGLQRHDCEPGHSTVHYADALEALKHIQSPEMRDDPSVKWAAKRLEQYDALQQGHFAQPSREPPRGDAGSYELLLKIIKQRRSVRNFLHRPVDRQSIQQVVESANWAPQSCNRQTMKVFVTSDLELVRPCVDTSAGATCLSEYIPCFMSFCADLRPYDLPGEACLAYVDLSLGAQNCCLIAHTLGLSVTFLSWCQSRPSDETKLRQLLSIPDHLMIAFNAIMGYPEYVGEAPARKDMTSTWVIRTHGGRSERLGDQSICR